MKKSLALILVLLFCLMAACGNDGGTTPSSPAAGAPGSSAPPSSSGSGEEPREDASSASGEDDTSASGTGAPASTAGGADDAAVWEEMTLIDVQELPQGGQSLTAVGENGSLLTFAAPEAVAYSAELGDELVLRPGMTVQVGYDGYVRETYPGQITAKYLTAEAYDGGLISLYLDALEDLYGQDDGMNDSCTYFGFDLSGAPGLTPAEQQAVGWVFAASQGCEPLFGTIEELGREGYINMEGLYWEDGLHFTLRADGPAEDCFTLDCTKWKSGTGAIGYQQAVGKKDGLWTMGDTSGFWIS